MGKSIGEEKEVVSEGELDFCAIDCEAVDEFGPLQLLSKVEHARSYLLEEVKC